MIRLQKLCELVGRTWLNVVDLAVSLCVQITEIAFPVAVVFEITNLIISTVLRAAFGGRLYFGG